MSTKSKTAWATLVLATLSFTTACASPDGLGEEEIGTAQQAAETENSLSWNGLTMNGLTTNGLTTNGLTTNGLTTNGLVMTALQDALSQKFLSYVVSCALPSASQFTVNISGTDVPFSGGLGIGPGWGLDGGSCDANCKAWVSACVLSRVNYLGQHVPLSERGALGSLATSSTERTAYPNREGAYWGNVFSVPQVRYACQERGSTLISRPCGPDIASCIMTVVGYCDAVCDAPDPTDGSYRNCRDSQDNVYPQVVTVFRQ